MPKHPFAAPKHQSYDVVIIGGAIMGSSTAWFLSADKGFGGRVLVIERDPTYEYAATSLSFSCIRQQFSTDLNVRISQFGAHFVQNLAAEMGGDDRIPHLPINNFGYMYLAATESAEAALRASHAVQAAAGAGTRLMSVQEIAAAFPFYALDDIRMGSFNSRDEGYFEGITLFDWFRRKAREGGVEYIPNEVTGMRLSPDGRKVEGVTLATGETVACGVVVNASGTRGAITARMAGIDLPIEPRKRHNWVFTAERPLDRPLPLTIDPTGIYVRQDGVANYLAGGHAVEDGPVDHDDFSIDPDLWMDHAWPAIATRIPQFEAIRVTREWVGHYDYNLLDQNAIMGPHPKVGNFLFMNGFSGHGLQQSPAMGRGTAEWIVHGEYRSLDLRPFHFERIAAGKPYLELAII